MLDLQEHFGARVRELREAAGWSQAALAKAVKIAQSKLPAIEMGKRDVKLSTVRRFSRALACTIRDLLPLD